jgi:hypothetical protein
MAISKTQPRFIRQNKVPEFFAVSRGFFDKYIRPSLTEIWWGDTPQSGISYDVLEMNALADKIVERNGRPAKKGEKIWDVKQQVSSLSNARVIPTGTLKGRSSKAELDKALALHRKKKQL